MRALEGPDFKRMVTLSNAVDELVMHSRRDSAPATQFKSTQITKSNSKPAEQMVVKISHGMEPTWGDN